ncbi:MAG: threonine ammonia-lyase [Acidobacteriota bacterium]
MIDITAIEAARERIAGKTVVTPTLWVPELSHRTGFEVYVKFETMQLTGSFKLRGAFNKLLTLGDEAREHGVIAASAGNHAQGVAYAAGQLGVPATIVMPETTPLVKVDRTEALGARAVLAGETFDDAYDRARQLEKEQGALFVHPFDDDDVIAGQGTAGLELLDTVPDLEAVIVPIGGGGLISGVASALRAKRPDMRIYGVQSERAPAMKRSFDAGQVVPSEGTIYSIADGLAVKRPATRTLDIIKQTVDDIILVSETAIEAAVVDILDITKTLTEGAGAAGVAALANDRLRHELHGKKVGVVLCGGNIDLNRLALLIDRALVQRQRLVRLRATVDDRPGSLAGLLSLIAQQGGNVVGLVHDRVFAAAPFGQAGVVVTLEVRNRAHIESVISSLRAADIAVHELNPAQVPLGA